jgi:2-aminoadipate transaminase
VARDAAFDTDRLLPAAMAAGVTVTPSSAFDPSGRYRRAIRVNFTANAPERLVEGVRRLAGVMRGMAATG